MVKRSLLISLVLSFVSVVAFIALSTSTASANTSNVSVSVPVSCNMSSTLDTPHSATVYNGTVTEDIGTTTFKVFCNDNTGYAIYAIGYSGEEYGNTNLLAYDSSHSNIATGLNTSGDTSNWAMKLNPVAGTYAPTIENDFSSYRTVPDTYTKVATFTSSTDFTIGSSLQSTYRVFISGKQPADTYTGKVKYTLVHPNDAEPPFAPQPQAATPRCISYWPNASGVVDSMADDCNSGPTGIGYGNNAAVSSLWATNFRRDGYGFAGWSDKFDWVLNENDENGNGTGPNESYHIYGPNATITTPPDMTENGLSLYAVWVKSSGSLQNWNGCSSLTTGQVTALTDARDNNTYAVAKLADGKCWTVENLRLDNEYTVGAENKDKAQGYASNFIGLADPETANFTNSTVANSLYSTDGSTSAPAITGSYTGYRFPRFNNQNTASPATNMTGTGNNTYSYGNYYTWPAAIANTSFYSTNNQVVSNTSICPAGWRLPVGGQNTVSVGQNGDFYVLTTTLAGEAPNNPNRGYAYYNGTPGTNASNKLRNFPNNFIYSGNFNDSSAYYRGTSGIYLSRTVGIVGNSYGFTLSSSLVSPGTNYGGQYYGKSIRCVQ